VIAEQFGTLAELHPDRIDLGLGRAPGSDTATMRAMRRDELSSERFPQDVQELQGWLGDNSPVSGVIAIPGKGTHVPLYILGSSLFGAQLAAVLGLPYAFASHFAPHALFDALDVYRQNFKPSEQLAEPYAMAGVGVIAAADKAEADRQLEVTRRVRVKSLFKTPGGGKLSDEEVDQILDSPRARAVDEMLTYSAVGTGTEAAAYMADFQAETGVQELITVHYADSVDNRVRSVEILAEAAALSEPATA
jgi:luciferase family oxidoreductase group 1